MGPPSGNQANMPGSISPDLRRRQNGAPPEVTTQENQSLSDLLIDIKEPLRLGFRRMMLILFVGSLCLISVILLTALASAMDWPIEVCLIGMVVLMFIVYFWAHRKSSIEVDRLATRVIGLGSEDFYVELSNCWWFGLWMGATHSLAKHLARNGLSNLTIRLNNYTLPRRIKPIDVPFEPRLLNESDVSTADFIDSLDARPHQRPPSPNDSNPYQRRPARNWIIRNVSLKGGWLLVCIFGFNFLINVFISLDKGTITWQTWEWGLFFLATFLIPSQGWFPRSQWFLIPGGILVRSTRRRQLTSEVRVFGRTESVLILQQRNKLVWTANVADIKGHSFLAMTHAESQMLLRAWLSPIRPPDVEKLVDFQ